MKRVSSLVILAALLLAAELFTACQTRVCNAAGPAGPQAAFFSQVTPLDMAVSTDGQRVFLTASWQLVDYSHEDPAGCGMPRFVNVTGLYTIDIADPGHPSVAVLTTAGYGSAIGVVGTNLFITAGQGLGTFQVSTVDTSNVLAPSTPSGVLALASSGQTLALLLNSPAVFLHSNAGPDRTVSLPAGAPAAIANAFGKVFALVEGTAGLLVGIDPASNQIVDSLEVCPSSGFSPVGWGEFLVVCTDGSVQRVNATLTTAAAFALPNSPVSAIAAGAGQSFGLYTFDQASSQVFDLSSGGIGNAVGGASGTPFYLDSNTALVPFNQASRVTSSGAVSALPGLAGVLAGTARTSFAAVANGQVVTPGTAAGGAPDGELPTLSIYFLDPTTGETVAPPVSLPTPPGLVVP